MAQDLAAHGGDMAAVMAQATAEMKEEERIDAVQSLGGAGTRSLLAGAPGQDTDLSSVAQEILQAQPDLAQNMAALKNIPSDILAAAAAAALPPQALEPIPPRPAAVAPAASTTGDAAAEDSDDDSDDDMAGATETDAEAVDDAPSAPPRTEHEPPPQAFAPQLDVQLDGSVTMTATGSVVLLQKAQHSVIIQHRASAAAQPLAGTVASGGRRVDPNAPSQQILRQVAANILDEGSLVALKPLPGTIAPRIIGRVREVFGNVSEPMYLVQLSAEQCSEEKPEQANDAATSVFHAMAHMTDLTAGEAVFSIAEFSSLVDPSKCRAGKPTDASNRYDEEASDSEFSDDEAEAAARKAARHKRQAEQSVPDDMQAAAAAAGQGAASDASKRRRRAGKRRQPAAQGVAASTGPASQQTGAAAATIAAQQAQIQALQAHLASMQQAMATGVPQVQSHVQATVPYARYTAAPVQSFVAPGPVTQQPRAQQQPAQQQRVPSSAAQQFMAAAARAAANVAKTNVQQ